MTYKELKKEYNDVLLRCGLTHAMDIGFRELQDLKWDEIEQDVNKRHDNYEKNGEICIMTRNFEMDLQRCAYEIARMPYDEQVRLIKGVF